MPTHSNDPPSLIELYLSSSSNNDPEPTTVQADATKTASKRPPQLGQLGGFARYLKTGSNAERRVLAHILEAAGNPKATDRAPIQGAKGQYSPTLFGRDEVSRVENRRIAVEELAHGIQFNPDGKLSRFGHRLRGGVEKMEDVVTRKLGTLFRIAQGRGVPLMRPRAERYKQPGHFEHEAHSEIAPQLHDMLRTAQGRQLASFMQKPGKKGILQFLRQQDASKSQQVDRADKAIRQLQKLKLLKDNKTHPSYQLRDALGRDTLSLGEDAPIERMSPSQYTKTLGQSMRTLIDESLLSRFSPYGKAYELANKF